MPHPFHLALNVNDLDEARQFYADVLGCQAGRSTETWADFNFFGHQISLHLGAPVITAPTGEVGNHKVPMPHFGVVLPMVEWRALSVHLTERGIDFVIAPQIRFEGKAGEQATLFFTDPSGNPIEIKGFADMDTVFDG